MDKFLNIIDVSEIGGVPWLAIDEVLYNFQLMLYMITLNQFSRQTTEGNGDREYNNTYIAIVVINMSSVCNSFSTKMTEKRSGLVSKPIFYTEQNSHY
jgi:hypothetical protein